jgi:cell division protein FtsI (penicillin-binding protein 3)
MQVRMAIPAVLIALFLGAALHRAWDLQLVQAGSLMTEARRNYLRSVTFERRRGEILDRFGEQLATSVQVETVVANPKDIHDPAAAAAQLAPVLGIDTAQLEAKLRKPSYWQYLKRRVPTEEAAQIHALAIPGVFTVREWKRYYPKRDLGAQLLGHVGIDTKGMEGVERALEPVLLPRDPEKGALKVPYFKDYRGQAAYLSGVPDDLAPEGYTVQLTIDEKIQELAEEALAAGVPQHNGKSGIAIVMDVPTGEILAMANWPGFNPNELMRFEKETWRNRAVKDIYEPGSTFKIFSLAAVMEHKAARLDEVIDVEGGRAKFGADWVRDTHRSDSLTVREVIGQSSNVGIAKLTRRIGKQALHNALVGFGFGAPTGIAFDAEGKGIVQPIKRWAEITFANVSFGQGIAVTPIQLVRAAAALGNGGALMKPKIVDRILTRDGQTVHEVLPQRVGQAVSPEAARAVIEAMKACVSEEGTGKAAAIPGYTVAGKTGTAQKAVGGVYREDKWIASFVGLVPAEDPRLAVLVVVDEPDGRAFGGQVAAPIFKVIAEGALHRLGVSPSQPRPVKVARLNVETALSRMKQPPTTPEPELPPADAQAGSCAVPDLLGLTMSEAIARTARAGLVANVRGGGVAIRQSLAPHTAVPCGQVVDLSFESALAAATAGGSAAP